MPAPADDDGPRRARGRIIMKRTAEVLMWLTALALFAFAGRAVFAAAGDTGGAGNLGRAARADARPGVRVVIVRGEVRQGGSVVRRADPEDGPREGRDEDRRPRRRETDPASVMRAARTLYVRPTRHLDKKHLEYEPGKRRELADWGLALVTEEHAADLVPAVDKTAPNYIFTVSDPRTTVIVATGKTVAINGLVAAENLGREIVKKIRDVRASPDASGRRRQRDDDEP